MTQHCSTCSGIPILVDSVIRHRLIGIRLSLVSTSFSLQWHPPDPLIHFNDMIWSNIASVSVSLYRWVKTNRRFSLWFSLRNDLILPSRNWSSRWKITQHVQWCKKTRIVSTSIGQVTLSSNHKKATSTESIFFHDFPQKEECELKESGFFNNRPFSKTPK